MLWKDGCGGMNCFGRIYCNEMLRKDVLEGSAAEG
jgi:hypothetical protein